MKINSKLIPLVERQLNIEEYSSRVYYDMANWCSFAGWKKAAEFYKERSEEELTHRDKIAQFLLDCSYPVNLKPIPVAEHKFSSLEDTITNGLTHEQKVSKAVLEVMSMAEESGDENTEAFFHWFVNEQREEEAIYTDLISYANKIGLFSDAPEWSKGMMRAQLEKRMM